VTIADHIEFGDERDIPPHVTEAAWEKWLWMKNEYGEQAAFGKLLAGTVGYTKQQVVNQLEAQVTLPQLELEAFTG